MKRSTRRTRLATATLAGGAALTLASCGVLHDGGTAATYKDTTVSVEQVQDAVTDIRKVAPTAELDGQRAALLLALRPALAQLGARNGVGVSDAQITDSFHKQGFPQDQTPAASAVQVIQADGLLSGLQENPAGAAALQKLLSTADIDLNPRYGTWKRGGQVGPAANNWLKVAPAPAGAPQADPAAPPAG